MFHLLLAHQFENRRGHWRVLNRQYALEEACAKSDIDSSLPWAVSVRPGMRVNMSIVFKNVDIVRGLCPRCETPHNLPDDVNFKW
jgi:hypothetical protein